MKIEDQSNWQWFLKNLKDAFQCELNDYVLMSDRDKGLLSAIQKELPAATYTFCIRHLVKNAKTETKAMTQEVDQEVEKLIYKAAKVYNKNDF